MGKHHHPHAPLSVKKDVRRQLEDEGEGVDLSELIDQLLTDWFSKSSG